MLDRHQPDYVSMESFYNFHPALVSAANLYERGQVYYVDNQQPAPRRAT